MTNLPQRRPLLYLITDRRAFRRHPEDSEAALRQAQLNAVALAAQAGCSLIQIREPDLSSRELCAFARALIAAARPHGARVLVNDRLDAALAVGADGVHLRVSSLPVRAVKATVEQLGLTDFLIGASTHSVSEAQAAAGGADFIVCGPVYDTPSKRAYGPPLGIAAFAAVCRSVNIPVLALGGITPTN